MALPVLDGNQSATTLSSVVTGGEHIVAHTVVSLGSTAISNITSAVSGSVVSISNFPSTQTIAGTVTANVENLPLRDWDDVIDSGKIVPVKISQEGEQPVPISGTVTVGNSVTVAGTVTANGGDFAKIPAVETSPPAKAIRIGFGTDENWNGVGRGASGVPLPVAIFDAAGVSDGIGFTNIGGNSYANVNVGNSVTIGSLPTLTPQLPRVTFIDGSGSVTTANSAITVFASSTTRSYLLVQVTTGSAFVNVGATATTLNGISLTAGQGYAWETTIPQGAVSLISSTTNSAYVAKQA